MTLNSFKIASLCLLGATFIVASGAADAQVFSPRASGNQGKAASSSSNAAPTSTTATKSEPVAEDTIKKNFSAESPKAVYDNRTPKIISFKIVNGEVIMDAAKDRSVLVYYDNYQIYRGLDEYVRCSLRIYVLNDLTEKISNLSFKLYWPEISTSVQMSQLNPGVNSYKDITLLGDGCFALDKAPTIEVNRCRVKGMSQEKCADAIKWYEKPQN